MKRTSPRQTLRALFDALFDRYGPQHWWPGETPFEVMVGAILTQNAAWSNVEKAIANLKAAGPLTSERLLAMGRAALALAIRPAGYFNVKERRLRSYLEFYRDRYGASIERMRARPLAALREELLEVHGVGRETADSMLLYALGKPIFVIDAYTRRVFSRHKLCRGDEPYDDLRAMVEEAIAEPDEAATVARFNEFHGLLVRLGKEQCRPTPRCAGCPLLVFPRSAAAIRAGNRRPRAGRSIRRHRGLH